jgi:hypothetical protein
VIAGWQDWYATAELQAFEQLKVPKRALLEPCSHYWPELALPGPRLDVRGEYLGVVGSMVEGRRYWRNERAAGDRLCAPVSSSLAFISRRQGILASGSRLRETNREQCI